MMNTNATTPALSMTESLRRSWQTVIINVWLFAGFTMLYYIAAGIAGSIPGIGMFTGLFSFVLSVSMFSGMQAATKHGTLDFRDFFNWTPRFGKLFVAYLVLIGIGIVIFLPLIILIIFTVGYGFFGALSFNNYAYFSESASLFSGWLALVVTLLFLATGLLFLILSFSYMFLVQFRNLSPGQALRQSWAIGKANIGSLIIFVLISIGVALLGLLALIIGILVAIPVILGMQYYFLSSIYPEDDASKDWDFMADQDTTDRLE